MYKYSSISNLVKGVETMMKNTSLGSILHVFNKKMISNQSTRCCRTDHRIKILYRSLTKYHAIKITPRKQ